MNNRTIAVIGATGSQGKSVVENLKKDESFKIRAITRNVSKYEGLAHEVVFADLNDIESLKAAFKDAYGVFAVTNFWENNDEYSQGKNIVDAAKAMEIKHIVWSTLPNVEKISQGEFSVPHFTGKARVDELISKANFEHFTFVQAPFYFQNLSGMMAAQEQEDGSMGWTMPLDPTRKVIHMGDINDIGKIVLGVFQSPDKTGNGSYLSLAAGLYSFNDVINAFDNNGRQYSYNQVPTDVYSSFFEGAGELAQMFGYFEKYTYMGPESEANLKLAEEVATDTYTSLTDWIKELKV